MEKEKKDPRWLSFLNSMGLFVVGGLLGYGVWVVRGLHAGSLLLPQHMFFISVGRAVFAIGTVVIIASGLLFLSRALKETDG